MYAARAMDAVRRIVRGLRATHAVARSHSISAAQLFVLRQIAAEPGLGLSDIARRTMTSPSSASEVTTRLVDAGFVVRAVAARDQRRAEFRLTQRGADAIAGTDASVQERLLIGYASLNIQDRTELARLLEEWVRASGLGALPATMFFEPMDPEVKRLSHSAVSD